jgi:hypothetical protein
MIGSVVTAASTLAVAHLMGGDNGLMGLRPCEPSTAPIG